MCKDCNDAPSYFEALSLCNRNEHAAGRDTQRMQWDGRPYDEQYSQITESKP